MSADGRMVTMAKPHPTKDYDLFVQRVETTNVTKLGSFPGLPRDPRSSNYDDDNLLWLGTNRLVIACGTEDTRQPYRVELYDAVTGRRINALSLPPQELGLSVRLWRARDNGFWFEARERYLIDDDLTSARPAASVKRDFLVTRPDGTRTLVNELPATLHSTHADRDIVEVTEETASPDSRFLLLRCDSTEGAVYDLRAGKVVSDAVRHPICWVDRLTR